ncbi:MAG: hypothetical protein GY797_32995, partial [Deltaproteobacteria bacterium]|nr:hypothetical protein [Deltaproteobacteria bacterium]
MKFDIATQWVLEKQFVSFIFAGLATAMRLRKSHLTKAHSGFNVYCGNAIWPHYEEGLENLSRYIIRASFSQERMTYIAADKSADGPPTEAFIIYDQSSSPGADDYIIDADYPIES